MREVRSYPALRGATAIIGACIGFALAIFGCRQCIVPARFFTGDITEINIPLALMGIVITSLGLCCFVGTLSLVQVNLVRKVALLLAAILGYLLVSIGLVTYDGPTGKTLFLLGVAFLVLAHGIAHLFPSSQQRTSLTLVKRSIATVGALLGLAITFWGIALFLASSVLQLILNRKELGFTLLTLGTLITLLGILIFMGMLFFMASGNQRKGNIACIEAVFGFLFAIDGFLFGAPPPGFQFSLPYWLLLPLGIGIFMTADTLTQNPLIKRYVLLGEIILALLFTVFYIFPFDIQLDLYFLFVPLPGCILILIGSAICLWSFIFVQLPYVEKQ